MQQNINKHPPRLSLLSVMAVKLKSGGKQVRKSPKKSTGTARGRPPAPRDEEGSSSVTQRQAGRARAQRRESKWSYQIVFPLDGPRLTVAALLLSFSLEQKESIASCN